MYGCELQKNNDNESNSINKEMDKKIIKLISIYLQNENEIILLALFCLSILVHIPLQNCLIKVSKKFVRLIRNFKT